MIKVKKVSYNEVVNDNYAKLYKFLFDDKFMAMSDSAKILYSLLRDRMQLSIRNVKEGNNYWVDDNGYIFIHATKEDIKEMMCCSDKKAIKLKKELVKFELIEDVRIGNNKPNKIYVLNVDYFESLDKSRKCTNDTTGSVQSELPEVYKEHSNKTNINKTKKNKTNNNIEPINIPPEIKNIANEIEDKIKCDVNQEVLNNTINKNNLLLEDIRYYLSHWHKFDYKTKDNPVAFLLHLVKTKAEIPKRQKGINKPEQSMNFEQRVYDDDYFESLYENFKYGEDNNE